MTDSVDQLKQQARSCTACDLYRNATQTVFGEGPTSARATFVGEQPGDKEDLAGEPFVGPAGTLLDQAMEAAGIDRSEVYVTNAVKHFKWKPRGKVRLHQKPNLTEVRACHQWLEGEIAAVQPAILVLLGATAAQSLLGPAFRLTQHRGEWLTVGDTRAIATIHPSAILRTAGPERAEAFDGLVNDLKLVASALVSR
jgi:uracil-DNA glycosylase family protein